MYAPLLLDVPLFSPMLIKQPIATMKLADKGFMTKSKRLSSSGFVYHSGGGFIDWIKKIFGIVKKGVEVASPIIKDVKDALPGVISTVKDVVNKGQEAWQQIKEGNIKDAINTSITAVKTASDKATELIDKAKPHVNNVNDLLNHTKNVMKEKEKQAIAQTAIATAKNNELKQEEAQLNKLTRSEAINEATDPKYDAIIPSTVQSASGVIRSILKRRGMKTIKKLSGRGFKSY